MKLSLFTDLGLRMLMCMAGSPEKVFLTSELADDLKVSRNHLNKVVSRLAKSGFISAKRGNNGGITLARQIGDIRLGEVVAALEADTPIVDCFKLSGVTCTLTDRCKLACRLETAKKQFLASLNNSTLGDVGITKGDCF